MQLEVAVEQAVKTATSKPGNLERSIECGHTVGSTWGTHHFLR